MRIVEIGPEYNPIYRCSRSVLDKINNNAQYVGIDINYNHLQRVRDHGHLAIQGSLGRIPLANGVADEVWLMNVFGEDNKSRSGLSYGNELRELSRITRSGGIVYIGEIYTPATELKTEDFERFGFHKDIYDGDRYQDFIQEMRFSPIYLAFQKKDAFFDGFFIALTKF